MKYVCKVGRIDKNYGAEILRSRGISNVEQFINPTKDNLQSYKDLENIWEGANLIKNLNGDSRVALLVDADVDGYTSAAIIYQYLKDIYPTITIDYYLHDGKQHGFEDKWEEIAEHQYNLIVAPDAATNDQIYVKHFDCPVLVIDHHLSETDEHINDMIIINNQLSPNYKNKSLSGAGMAYQFCRCLDEVLGVNFAEKYVDLAAWGVCGDMMSGLEIENQYLWKQGFSHINNYFFQVLCDKQSYSMGGKINPMSVAFYIVPLINAMVRMGTAEEKNRMFLALIDGHQLVPSNKRGAKGTMEEVAVESARECTNAKSHQDKKKKEISEKLEIKIAKYDLLSNKVLFIRLDQDDEDFPSELNGLVCTQLSVKYGRPTIVARLNDEGFIRGSARGLNKSALTSFKNFLNESNYFEYTVGHDQAFGCSINNKDLVNFLAYANEKLASYNFGENVYEVDLERNAAEHDIAAICFDLANYEDIWSQNNDQPLIAITNLFIDKSDIHVIGKNKDTLRFEKNGITYIKFFAKDLIAELEKMDDIAITLVGKPVINEWMGHQTPQIQIEEIQVEDGMLAF